MSSPRAAAPPMNFDDALTRYLPRVWFRLKFIDAARDQDVNGRDDMANYFFIAPGRKQRLSALLGDP